MKFALLPTSIIFILLISSCHDEIPTDIINLSNRYEGVGDTVFTYAKIRRTESINSCSDGFDNFKLYTGNTAIGLCAMRDSSNYSSPCLPDYFKKDDMIVRISYIVLPIPPNVRMNCAPIKLLTIKAAGHPTFTLN